MSATYGTPSKHYPIRPDWLALHEESALDPALPIVDAHHHLWDYPGRRYLPLDLLADHASGHDIRATVAVEAGAMYRADAPRATQPVGETEFLNGAAAMGASGDYGHCQLCAGIVGHADLLLGTAVRPVLEAHLRAGGGRFRGVRHISAWHADPDARGSMVVAPEGLLSDVRFRQGFAQLNSLDLSFDAWLYHTQLQELADLARAFPETAIILDHVGGAIGIGPYAGKRKETFVAWESGIHAVAACPNVYVKLGGLGMRLFGFEFAEAQRPPTSQALADAWRPYIDTCIAAFGPQRAMFESNFPVDKGCCSYGVLWNAFKRIVTGASADEKAALFSATARKVYRLPTR